MATLPRTRRIEEILREAQLDPRVTAIIVEIAERQRNQHQQIYEIATLISKFQDHISQLHQKMHIRDGNLESLGVREMMTNMQNQKTGALVESVEDFDQSTSDHGADTGRKN